MFSDTQLAHAAEILIDTQYGSPEILVRRMAVPIAVALGLLRTLNQLKIVTAPGDNGMWTVRVDPLDRSAALAAVRDGSAYLPGGASTGSPAVRILSR